MRVPRIWRMGSAPHGTYRPPWRCCARIGRQSVSGSTAPNTTGPGEETGTRDDAARSTLIGAPHRNPGRSRGGHDSEAMPPARRPARRAGTPTRGRSRRSVRPSRTDKAGGMGSPTHGRGSPHAARWRGIGKDPTARTIAPATTAGRMPTATPDRAVACIGRTDVPRCTRRGVRLPADASCRTSKAPPWALSPTRRPPALHRLTVAGGLRRFATLA